jgi:hypothetical protein
MTIECQGNACPYMVEFIWIINSKFVMNFLSHVRITSTYETLKEILYILMNCFVST